MKRNLVLFVAILAIVSFMWAATPARAEDVVLKFKPSSVSILKDRSGNEYVRFIMPDSKELSGIRYSAGISVNAYREMVEQAKALKPGQEVTVVASKREYNGSTYYTILAFGGTTTAAKK